MLHKTSYMACHALAAKLTPALTLLEDCRSAANGDTKAWLPAMYSTPCLKVPGKASTFNSLRHIVQIACFAQNDKIAFDMIDNSSEVMPQSLQQMSLSRIYFPLGPFLSCINVSISA